MGGLQKDAVIGIVSGSPYEYISQQMSAAWKVSDGLNPEEIMLMPCNGTQLFKYSEDARSFIRRTSTNMIEFMGVEKYRIMISILTDLQNQVIETYDTLPLSGNFISFRESMVNWCMIGRDATNEMRSKFVEMDRGLRQSLHAQFREELKSGGITDIESALGGSTSIDIYPEGWDKTYCLNHIEQPANVYFVGDKCHPGGNDYEIFESNQTVSFETDGPSTTLHIIKEIRSRLENV